MPDLHILQLSPSAEPQRAQWADYVARAEESTFFHSLQWMDAVRTCYPHRPFYLMAVDRGVRGVLPLFEVRSILAGTILVSVPYATYGGPLCDDRRVAEALLVEVQALARRLKARYVDIRSRRPCWPQMTVVDRYVTFVKALPSAVHDVLAGLPRKARAEVRRAREKFGLQVSFDASRLDTVWDLYSRSMRRLGSPNFPRRFFQAVCDATPQHHVVSVVSHRGQPVAGLLGFIYGDTILPYFSGCLHKPACRLGANNLLYASLMEQAVSMGLRRFDFGRTRRDNTGSFNFKKNQGFEPTPLGYQVDLPLGGGVPNLTPSNRRFRVARKVWTKLPLTVTRPLGSWLSASIPG